MRQHVKTIENSLIILYHSQNVKSVKIFSTRMLMKSNNTAFKIIFVLTGKILLSKEIGILLSTNVSHCYFNDVKALIVRLMMNLRNGFKANGFKKSLLAPISILQIMISR